MSLIVSRRAVLAAAAMLPLSDLACAAAAPRGFTHSVASGDPKQDRVVLWTRYVPADGGVVALAVEVAEDERFARIVSRLRTTAGPETDFCAHVAAGNLRPGRRYHYRFVAPGGERSPAGRTRTLPAGRLDGIRLAVFSCANATSGWFNAYAHAAARDDIDLVVHLGDYIYESPVNRPDALAELAAAYAVEPRGEAVTLADYRLRYASYRADRGLQELHRQVPMIAMWDDHEVANNCWHGGAAGHQPGEGDWAVGAAAGRRAWHEWLPMGMNDYDSYELGDLATLFRIETRLIARSRPLNVAAALAGAGDVKQAAIAFRDGPLADPARTMMGARQEAWLASGFARSTAAGTRWQILAQQVILAPTRLPKVTSEWYAPGSVPTAKDQAELAIAAALAKLDVPTGLDRWDGYPAARNRLLDSAARARADLIVLTGDSHNAWAFDLDRGGTPVGVEFGGQSVSSLGIEKRFGGDAQMIARDFVQANPNLRWCDTSRRGYMMLDVTRNAVRNEWLFLPSRDERSTVLLGTHGLGVEHGARRLSVV